jgi:hypothetical protein
MSGPRHEGEFAEEIILYGDFVKALTELGSNECPAEEQDDPSLPLPSVERKWFRISSRQIRLSWIPAMPQDAWIPRALYSEICGDLDVPPDEFYPALHAVVKNGGR